VGITPEGAASTGAATEQLIPKDTNERLANARRIVAQRCLYGVDKNPLADEMAKLSLWLLTLATDKPFTFLDHAIRCGGSLVGIRDIRQVQFFQLDLNHADRSLFAGPVMSFVDEATKLRRKIESMPGSTLEDVREKEELLVQAEEKTARLRLAADLLISVEFQPISSAANKDDLHNSMAIQAGHCVKNGTIEQFRALTLKVLNGQRTFHWPLEFPEVIVYRGGFDTFICNLTWMGCSRISTHYGSQYTQYLLNSFPHCRGLGRVDLCTYFLLRAHSSIRSAGCFGMLTTNTISEGDTRSAGIEYLKTNGGCLYNALTSRKWPGDATLHISHIHFMKGGAHTCIVYGTPVQEISSSLDEQFIIGTPFRLSENRQRAFRGSMVAGEGFVVTHEMKKVLSEIDPVSEGTIFGYLTGEDLNQRWDQTPSRNIIDFGDRSESEARKYQACFKIIESTVKPQRMESGSPDTRKRWWQFGRRAVDLYQTIGNLSRVLVCSQVSKHLCVAFVPPGMVDSSMLVVFAFDKYADFSTLQSMAHEAWARQYSSSLETRVRYTPSDCFETFTRPSRTQSLEDVGETYYQARKRIMAARQEGLTDTYNRFHEVHESAANIQNLRDLHVEVDKAVAVAYGWNNLDLGHGFHETKQGVRFTISESARREVLARLLKLNHERYAEEVAQGLHSKTSGGGRVAGGGTKTTGRGRKSTHSPATANFLDGDEDDPAPVVPSAAVHSTRLTPSEGDVWYFAYGSNLSVARKVVRTGAISQAIPSRLHGYRLAFNKEAPGGRAYANVIPDPSGEVWGVVYLCNHPAMMELDRYEGVATGHYERLPVEVATRSGERMQAVAYVAGAAFVVDGAKPADEYLRLILDGARHHGLPEDYIRSIEAEARGAAPPSAVPPAAPPETKHSQRETNQSPATHHPPLATRRIDEVDTDDVMAAFRQASRGRGWLDRDELLKEVSLVLGYQRKGPKIEEALRNHLRAAIRRRIIEADGPSLVRAGTGTMADYDLEELRETFRSVIRKGTQYEREEVIHALARYLGFARVTDTSRDAIKSAINSAIRRGVLGYEGSVVWRDE